MLLFVSCRTGDVRAGREKERVGDREGERESICLWKARAVMQK
jgi:hypothetical protein